MNQKDFYKTIVTTYSRESHPPPSGRLARIWKRLELGREEAVFQLLDKGERFLDVGCAEGRLVFPATQKFSEVYGIDSWAERISRNQETVKRLGKDKIYFQVADVNQGIPFDDNYFDAVTCIATLEFLLNPPRVIQEFNRLLPLGGTLIIAIANIAYIPRRLRALLGKPPQVSATPGFLDGGVLHYFTLASLVSLIEQAGFSVVKKSAIGKLWFLRGWWLSLLASGIIVKAIKK